MYGIHRTEKRTRSSVYGLQIEANRTQEDHLKGREFHGSDIDWAKTNSNVFLIKNDNWNKTITETLKDNSIKERKTSIVLLSNPLLGGSTIILLPLTLSSTILDTSPQINLTLSILFNLL